jgi:FMN phosphatase YigB (HAD superfamily)
MWDAILFDLDGTLLDLDGNAFLDAYAQAVAEEMAPEVDPAAFLDALTSAAIPLLTTEHPGRTNRAVLFEALSTVLQVSTEFLEERTNRLLTRDLSRIYPGGGPVPGAHAAVSAALAGGYKIAVATMPIYPLAVIRERLRRAGLDRVPWDFVATDQMCTVKPHPTYFEEVAAHLGIPPARCLMVGDDYFQDIPARQAHMATFYIGPRMKGIDVGPTGTLDDLANRLRAAAEGRTSLGLPASDVP